MNADEFVSGDEIANVTLGSSLDGWGPDLRWIFANARKITNAQLNPLPPERQNSPVPVPAARGITVFFTGFSGAGKSTIANLVLSEILRLGHGRATLLDGELVRRHLSPDLGFSREHRDLNIRRIGYVASEITQRGGIAICAVIAPYDQARKEVRATVQQSGGFVLIHVATALEVCERRDPKGLYARARSGMLRQFTGVSDPYEPPDDAELVIDTTQLDAEAAAQRVLSLLDRAGHLANLGYYPPSPELKFTEKTPKNNTNS
jgi:sulfate adenylyltransferase